MTTLAIEVPNVGARVLHDCDGCHKQELFQPAPDQELPTGWARVIVQLFANITSQMEICDVCLRCAREAVHAKHGRAA